MPLAKSHVVNRAASFFDVWVFFRDFRSVLEVWIIIYVLGNKMVQAIGLYQAPDSP